jgi:hypothetical protein
MVEVADQGGNDDTRHTCIGLRTVAWRPTLLLTTDVSLKVHALTQDCVRVNQRPYSRGSGRVYNN